MNINEIDAIVWELDECEKANILHFLIGYAKSNKKFRIEFEKAISSR